MPNRLRLFLLGAVLLVAVLTVPLEAANKEHLQMMADLRILQQQTQVLQASLATLTEALKKIDAKLDAQAEVSQKSFADHKLLVNTVATEVRVVREKVDENNVRLTSLSQEVDAVRVAQAAAVVQGTAPAVTDPVTPPAGGATPPQTAVAPPPSGGTTPINPGVSPQRLFEQARADYYAASWSLAIQGFESYIKTFPKSDLVDDAQYYIGETYYASGRYREAVTAYDRVIAIYPASNTLPDAYYKRGLALQSLGDVAKARESYEFVVKTYPDSDAGRLARQAIDRLGKVVK